MRNCLFVALALVAGCHWDLNSKSTDPQSDQLYFPAGIAMDPGGQYVYVSNGNADLRYGGGTVMMVDMLSFECTVAASRRIHPLNVADATYPMPATCDPNVDYAHRADYDALCRRDALDPSIIICDESGFILQNSTVAVGNFAGTIRLLPDPNDPNHRTLFVSVRGDPSITRINVHFPCPPGETCKPPSQDPTPTAPGAPNPYVPSDINAPGVLQCVNNVPALAMRKQYDPVAQKSSAAAPCDNDFLIQDYFCENQPTCTVGVNNNGKTQLPTEPFGMQIDKSSGRLVVSHLATGQISVIDANASPPNALLSESSQFFPPDPTGRHGAFALAQQNPDDPHSLWYVTSSVNPLIAMFRIADANVVTVASQSTFSLQNTFSQGTDVRDIIFDTGGQRAFVTENNPPSLLVIDTSTDATEGAQPHNLVTDVIDICQTPSHTGVRRFTVAGAPGQPSYTKTKVMVVCFLSSQLMIVDPDRRGVDDTIFSGFAGPNDIAFNFADPGAAQPIASVGLPRHAYVTNYSESTIAVVDLEPGSVNENRVLAKLGHPPDGFNP
jgi:DNA-binding beta-propeller fold protein YncE